MVWSLGVHSLGYGDPELRVQHLPALTRCLGQVSCSDLVPRLLPGKVIALHLGPTDPEGEVWTGEPSLHPVSLSHPSSTSEDVQGAL